jgi:hypothetical protein
MAYYIRVFLNQNFASTSQVWKIDEDIAVRVGVSNAEHGPGSFFKAEPGETIWDALRRQTPWFEPDGQNPFHRTSLDPGEFYPRMARSNDAFPDESPGISPGAQTESNFIAIALGQLTALTRQLDRICQTIHPTPGTFDTFGHDIRNLLILACTEVESHWRGILIANGVTKSRFNTTDYVALQDALRLDEYAVEFPQYPWLAPLKPFSGWGRTGRPTQELAWYDSYNAVKHDRENEFERATLRHAFEAVTACAILMVAQFSWQYGLAPRSELAAFFHFSGTPAWPPSEVYIFSYGEQQMDWTPKPYKFNIGGN